MALLVNGEIVSDAAIAAQYTLLTQSYPGAQNKPDPILEQQLHRTAEENAILQAILYQQAAGTDVRVPPQEIQAELALRRGTNQSTVCSPEEAALIERELKAQRLIQHITRNVPRPTSRELEDLYTRSAPRYREPERLHVRHIIKNIHEFRPETDAKASLDEAQNALRSGTRFERVADKFSDCAGDGGNLGWITRSEMVPEFEEVVFALRPGQISGIFRTRFGLHIATLVARRAARTRPFSEVRPELAQEVIDSRRQTALLAYLRQESQRADIRAFRAPA